MEGVQVRQEQHTESPRDLSMGELGDPRAQGGDAGKEHPTMWAWVHKLGSFFRNHTWGGTVELLPLQGSDREAHDR